MRKDNTQNYKTSTTRVSHFNDFTSNIGVEKAELDKMNRSRLKNEPEGDTNLANVHMSKYNKVTHKYDVLSTDEVKDKIDAIEQDGFEEPKKKFKVSDDALNPNHFYKNVTDVKEMQHIETFEAYTAGFGNREEQGTQNNEVTPKPDIMASEHEIESDDDTQDYDYSGEEDIDNEVEYHHDGPTSYMFFGNLETINRLTDELYKMDHETVNNLLNEGHNWAEDHISTAKEMISHVYNFMMNEKLTEDIDTEEMDNKEEGQNYMFFANLETINTQTTELLQLDQEQIDDILVGGHDWAEDHMAAAKENIQQVYEFLKSELN